MKTLFLSVFCCTADCIPPPTYQMAIAFFHAIKIDLCPLFSAVLGGKGNFQCNVMQCNTSDPNTLFIMFSIKPIKFSTLVQTI